MRRWHWMGVSKDRGSVPVRAAQSSDHGCHGVTRLLPSGANREECRLPWACQFTAGPSVSPVSETEQLSCF